jgi:muconolactone delta-isomerase
MEAVGSPLIGKSARMEYLVTMTTHVPSGTPGSAVDDIRARESAHTSELAARGHVLRLWRPPLAPGEWRTLGLFAAADADELERVLASMPLRVWRSDEVKELTAHANDPEPALSPSPDATERGETATEFLVTFTPAAPEGTPAKDVEEATAREAERARELAKQGHLVRLWVLPAEHGVSSALGLWRAGDDAEMRVILDSLPLNPYLTTRTTKLTPHPSDPAAPGSRSPRMEANHG